MVPAYLTPLLLMAYFFIIKRKEAGRSRNAVTVQAMRPILSFDNFRM